MTNSILTLEGEIANDLNILKLVLIEYKFQLEALSHSLFTVL